MVGSIPNFFIHSDTWDTYAEILEQFFIVNNIEDEKKSAFLISCIGAETYKTLRDLCHPFLPKDKTFEELAELLRKQFSPQIAIFRERTNFYEAKQNVGENVISYYGRLKKLSVDCKFGEYLEAALLDKFVTGLLPGQVLDRLCEEDHTITLQQAVDIATNKECALKEIVGSTSQPAFYQPVLPTIPIPRNNYYNDRYRNYQEDREGSEFGDRRRRQDGNCRGGRRGMRRNENWRNQEKNEAEKE